MSAQPTVPVDRYQVFVSSVEIELQALTRLLDGATLLHIDSFAYRALRRIERELRAALDEACRQPVVEPADFIEQPH